MIKKLLFSTVLILTGLCINAQGTFSVLTSGSCYNPNGPNSFTATVFSSVTATSYSWSSVGNNCIDTVVASSGSTAVFAVQCCGPKVLMVTFYSGSSITGTAQTTVNFNCPPTINASFAAGNTICAGTVNTLVASGGVTYTVAPGNITLGTAFLVPSSSTCYTVVGSSSQGCTNYAIACLSVMPLPVLSISQSTQICLGQSVTLNVSGATSYVWSVNATGSSITVSPSSSACFSVLGTNASGCTAMASTCVSVSPLPIVFAVSNPATPICQGDAVELLAGGAVTYTWIPGSITAPNPTVYPQSTTDFTVAGYDGTCTAYATVEVTVLPSPILMTSNNYSMCLGTSVTMTAGGASTYTWNTTPPVNTATLNVMPAAWTMYTVSGTGSNGCSATMTVGVYPDAGCAIVWPGDANSDGVVNSSDVLELGLYANNTGASRTPGGNTYTGQYATAWSGSGSNSQNQAHIDCNGDGTVDQDDTLAISSNFSMTHSFRLQGGASTSDDITLVHSGPFYYDAPLWNSLGIDLGSATNTQNDVYGIAFDLHFDESFVEPGMAYITYPSSFLDAGNQNIPFRLFEAGQGVVHCVSVRTDHVDVDGFGRIAEFHFKNVQGKQGEMHFSVQNVQIINAQGQVTALSNATTSAAPVTIAGLKDNAGLAGSVHVYPNPAADAVTFDVSSLSNVQLTIMDVTGRTVIHTAISGRSTQDVSALSAGTYIVTFHSNEGTFNRKLIIE